MCSKVLLNSSSANKVNITYIGYDKVNNTVLSCIPCIGLYVIFYGHFESGGSQGSIAYPLQRCYINMILDYNTGPVFVTIYSYDILQIPLRWIFPY